MFLWLKTLYRKRAVTWPFIFYTIIWTLSFQTLDNQTDTKNEISSTRTIIKNNKFSLEENGNKIK